MRLAERHKRSMGWDRRVSASKVQIRLRRVLLGRIDIWMLTQGGDDARGAHVVLPWAITFCPFRALGGNRASVSAHHEMPPAKPGAVGGGAGARLGFVGRDPRAAVAALCHWGNCW